MIKNRGFTLLEIVLVIAAIAILSGIVIVALNPGKNLATARNTQRYSDIKSLSDASYQKSIDSSADILSNLSYDWQMIGTATSGCNVPCGVPPLSTSAPVISIDSNSSSFNLGSFSQTVFSPSDSALILNASGVSSGSGSYTSSFKNNTNANWTGISWTPLAPYGKPLPSGKQGESAYSQGNANMAGNVLLLHADESSGSTVFTDSSGSNNHGSCSANCPQSTPGRVNGSLVFKGTSSVITTLTVPNSSSLNPGNITVEAWVKWNINPSLGLPWSSIINKNLDRQYRLHHNSNNSKFEFAIDGNYITSLTAPQINKWYHLVGTYNGSIMRLYVNGVEESNKANSSAIPASPAPLYVGSRSDNGRTFNGLIDEAAVYSRALSSAEILDHYHRGAMRLKLKVRACSDQICSGVNFVGPDGTTSSYFSDDGSSPGLPSYSISGVSGNYFQYQAVLETDSTSSPKLSSVKIDSNGFGQENLSEQPYGNTGDSCVNLETVLTPNYLTEIPYDPQVGSLQRTYYAIRKSVNDRISVMSCSPELQKSILIGN